MIEIWVFLQRRNTEKTEEEKRERKMRVTGIVYWFGAMNPGDLTLTNGKDPRIVCEFSLIMRFVH